MPDDRKNRTKISLAGTGGMRLLQFVKQISTLFFKFTIVFKNTFEHIFQNKSQFLSYYILPPALYTFLRRN